MQAETEECPQRARLFDGSITMCAIVKFSIAVREMAKLGATDINYPFAPVSKWNTQNPACVFHFIHEAKKSEGMSLEVTSIGFVVTNPESTPLPGVDYPNQRRYMKKNDTRLQLRLSQKEKDKIERNARRCGMSVSGYVRQCCLGREPRTRPPDVFWELLGELYAIAALLPMPEQQRLSGLILRLQEAV